MITQPTPVFLPGESHGQRSLVGYKESDTTEVIDMQDDYSVVVNRFFLASPTQWP